MYGLEVGLENLWGCWSAGPAELAVWLGDNVQILLCSFYHLKVAENASSTAMKREQEPPIPAPLNEN